MKRSSRTPAKKLDLATQAAVDRLKEIKSRLPRHRTDLRERADRFIETTKRFGPGVVKEDSIALLEGVAFVSSIDKEIEPAEDEE